LKNYYNLTENHRALNLGEVYDQGESSPERGDIKYKCLRAGAKTSVLKIWKDKKVNEETTVTFKRR